METLKYSPTPTYPRRKYITNMVKFLMDVLQKLLYSNDSLIRRIVAEKLFAKDGVGFTQVAFKLH
jgi:Holliday junction resolvase RusA-like endonuclease